MRRFMTGDVCTTTSTSSCSSTARPGGSCSSSLPTTEAASGTSLTAPLRSAIDLPYCQEWQGKPVVLLSCTAGPSGGVPAVEALRPVLARIGFRSAERSISVPGFAELTGPGGFRARPVLPPNWPTYSTRWPSCSPMPMPMPTATPARRAWRQGRRRRCTR
ncbi:NADPH-dependent FMN reductase [Kitasatospora albolonga]